MGPHVWIQYARAIMSKTVGYLSGGCLIMLALALYQGVTGNIVSPLVYVVCAAATLVSAIWVYGVEQFRQLQPRLAVRSLERSAWPFERFGYTGIGYHFTVENLSAGLSAEDFCAQITAISPSPGYLPLPVPMKIKHRDWDVKTVSLSPEWKEQVDLIVGPSADPRSTQLFRIIYNSDPKEKFLDLRKDTRYRIEIRVGAKNVKRSEPYRFEAWVDERNETQCVMF